MSELDTPRRAGIVLPLFALRGAGWGIGEIPDLERFGRWAAAAGHPVLSILPVNDPSRGQNSPYAARTAFALDPAYLALERLEDFQAAGGRDALTPAERALLDRVRASETIRWDEVRALKRAALERAFRVFTDEVLARGGPRRDEFHDFVRRSAAWLDDYALYAVLHDAAGAKEWQRWPAPLRDRDPHALAAVWRERLPELQLHQYVQWQLERQWREMRATLARAGVTLLGDLPFVVAADSADVWAHRELFRLDVNLGVPPDAYSAEGQDWGLPVYRWEAMAQDGYAWMRRRAARAAALLDGYRVDHVVGLYRSYFIPKDGGERGFLPPDEEAQLAQGETLLGQLRSPGGEAGERAWVVAEDLGTVPDWVRASLTRLGVPGYRVLRWEKDDAVYRDPAAWPALSVGTTGTHDTDALADWYDGLEPAEREALWSLPGLAGRGPAPERFGAGVHRALVELVYTSGAELVLVPFQDLAGTRERINLPGTVADTNWVYRMAETLEALEEGDLGERLRALAERTGRGAPAVEREVGRAAQEEAAIPPAP